MPAAPLADPAAVVIVANATDPASIELAKWYAGRRSIPEANIARLHLPQQEGITRAEFEGRLLGPLIDWLVANQWMTGQRRGDFYEAFRHKVGHLVLMRGVPLRVEHEARALSWDEQIKMPPQEVRTASVDSEIALLPAGVWRIPFAVQNPLFENESPAASELMRVFKVTRLDGPSATDVKLIVDGAILAEQEGLAGRAYVDTGGPHPEGDRWIGDCAARLRELGFDVSMNGAGGMFDGLSRFDSPALYFGWYAPNASGPFLSPALRMSPGAIAFHLHSFSAETVRSPTAGWLGPLVTRGASVTFGNVAEPRLQFSHRPQHILAKLVDGWCLGDAAPYGTPFLSWQTVVIGDPLYRPFRTGLRQQLNQIEKLPPDRAPWVVIRQARTEQMAGETAKALETVRAYEAQNPGLAITLELARMQHAAGDRTGALQTLDKLRYMKVFGMQSWRVAADAAAFLAELGEHAGAAGIYDNLIAQVQLPKEVRIWLLEQALPLAPHAKEAGTRERWARLLLELRPPPPEPAAPPPPAPGTARVGAAKQG